jgi:hypothetical protein
MDIKPLVLGLLFIVLLWVLFNPPASGGDGKRDDHGGKGGKGAPKKH